MLFEQYVATLRLTLLEQVLGASVVIHLAPLLKHGSPGHKHPTPEQLDAISQLGSAYRERCPGGAETSLDEMATAVADSVGL